MNKVAMPHTGEVRWDTGAVLPLLYSPFGRKPDYPAAFLPALLGGEAGLPPFAGMLSPPGREHFFAMPKHIRMDCMLIAAVHPYNHGPWAGAACPHAYKPHRPIRFAVFSADMKFCAGKGVHQYKEEQP